MKKWIGLFLEHGEFRCFSVVRVSQGSVAAYVRCSEMTTIALYSKFRGKSASERIFKIG